MERGLNETVEVIGMSILLVWMMIGVSLMIYLACRYLDLIESELSGCSYVRDNQLNFSSAGFLGRLLRTCLAANMLYDAWDLCAQRSRGCFRDIAVPKAY